MNSVSGVTAEITLRHELGKTEFTANVLEWLVCEHDRHKIVAVLEPVSGVFTTPPRQCANYAEAVDVPRLLRD